MRLGRLLIVALVGCAPAVPAPTPDVPPPPPRTAIDTDPEPETRPPAPTPSCPPREAHLVFASMPPTIDTMSAAAFHPNLAVSQDSRLVAAPTMDGTIFVLDAERGAVRGELVGHRGEARAVAFVDARTLASVGVDRMLRLWDISDGRPTAELDLGADPTSLAASPRDGSLLVGTKDGKVRLFDRSGKALAVVDAHRKAVARVAWREDGAAFASSGRDGNVYHYASDGTNKTLLHTLGGAEASLLVQPGSGRIVFDWGTSDVIRLVARDRSFSDLSRWSARIGVRHDADVNPVGLSLAFSPDGRELAFATCSGHTSGHEFAARFGVVDVATDVARFFDGADGNRMTCPVAAVWTPDGRRIVRMSDRHEIAFQDPTTQRPAGFLSAPPAKPFGSFREEKTNKPAFEQRLAAALGVTLLPEHDDACDALKKRVDPDTHGFACDLSAGRLFAGDLLGLVHVHDARTGTKLASYGGGAALFGRRGTSQIAVAPDGKLVASWTQDSTLVVNEAKPPYKTTLERRGIGVVTRLSWTADGRHLAVFSGAVLRLVRLSDGAILRVELGIASDASGAFDDLGTEAAAFDLRDRTSTLAYARARIKVRVGDLATGDLVPLDRAASISRPGLVRAFLAGEATPAAQLAVCAGDPSERR